MSIKPFVVNVPQLTLSDLQERLSRTRWADEIPDRGWRYGTNLAYLRALTEHWLTRFDWRAQEAALNRYAHFRADLDGVGIHFIHERGKGDHPLPIVLTHGYPDSFVRFLKIIPMLTDPQAHGGEASDAFDVVVPSLPGYGFSDKPSKAGMTFRIGDVWHTLMTKELGYPRFAAQGGDWGSSVTEQLALADRYAALAASTRKAIDAAGKAGDADTSDLFTGISRGLDKALWFLEAHLG